ncbi:MAG: glycosyltransferase [Novosphingobium sp.]|nr:glycosyltransferase [Novosphingobium sp.]
MADELAPGLSPAPPQVRVGILFAQFAAYHLDRCEAAARRLVGQAEVVAVEVAQSSRAYAWAPSGEVRGAHKRVLFADRAFEAIPRLQRLRAMLAALGDCDVAFVGIGYDQPDVLALAWMLRLKGKRVVLMSESKADDARRRWWREAGKRVLLWPFAAALVGGPRHAAYMRSLGFRRRPVVEGYDTVSLERVRAMGGAARLAPADRPFVFVGRFVAKKNLALLIEAFGRYRRGGGRRNLVLVGGGELHEALRARIAAAGLDGAIAITGFVDAAQVGAHLADARALLLASSVEQWGLVVNEALAFGLPVAVSEAVGARETLVAHGGNGFVLASDDAAAWAEAMRALDDDALRARMSDASRRLAPAGDVERFAAGVERLAGL